MIRKLDRYVLKELAVPTISATLLVAGLFAGNELIHVYQTFNVNNIPVLTMLKMVILSLPSWLTYTLPVGVAMGCSLAMSRLTREGELTAIRASGVPIWRAMFMIWLVGIAAGGLTFYIGEYVAPKARKEHTKVGIDAVVVSGFPDLQQNLSVKLGQYNVSLREVRKLDDSRYALVDVVATRWLNDGEAMIFKAPTGAYDNGIWSFPNGNWWQLKDDSLVSFRTDSLTLNQENVLPEIAGATGVEHRTREELWEAVESAREQGAKKTAVENEVNFYVRYSVPAACLVFALAASYLSIRFSRASAFQGLMYSLVMALAYYNLHMICISIIGPNGWLPPMYAAWLPVGVFGITAVIVGSKLE